MSIKVKSLVAAQLAQASARRGSLKLPDDMSDDMKQWKKDMARMEEETWEWVAQAIENIERKSRRDDFIMFIGIPCAVVLGIVVVLGIAS